MRSISSSLVRESTAVGSRARQGMRMLLSDSAASRRSIASLNAVGAARCASMRSARAVSRRRDGGQDGERWRTCEQGEGCAAGLAAFGGHSSAGRGSGEFRHCESPWVEFRVTARPGFGGCGRQDRCPHAALLRPGRSCDRSAARMAPSQTQKTRPAFHKCQRPLLRNGR
jgi:hypothetical protein